MATQSAVAAAATTVVGDIVHPMDATPIYSPNDAVGENSTTFMGTTQEGGNPFVSIGDGAPPAAASADSVDPLTLQLMSDSYTGTTTSYSEQGHYEAFIKHAPGADVPIRKFTEWQWRPTVFVKDESSTVMAMVNQIPTPVKGSKPRRPSPKAERAVHKARANLLRAQSVGDVEEEGSATLSNLLGSTGERQQHSAGSAATASPTPPCLAEDALGDALVADGEDGCEDGGIADDASDCSSSASERTVGDDGPTHTRTLYNIPTSNKGPEYFAKRHTDAKKKLLIMMVGLPAQGKTFLAQKLCRLLGWNGCPSQVLNLQVPWREKLHKHVRRNIRKNGSFVFNPANFSVSSPTTTTTVPSPSVGGGYGGETPNCSPSPSIGNFPNQSSTAALPIGIPASPALSSPTTNSPSAAAGSSGVINSSAAVNPAAPPPSHFFKQFLTNPDSVERKIYTQVLKEQYPIVEAFYKGGGQVMILNDDFPTRQLRQEVADLYSPLVDNIMYIEVQRNTKVNLDLLKMQAEYSSRTHMSGDAILDDFQSRIKLMESVYEPMDPTDPTVGYVRLLESSVLESHRLTGYIQSRIVSFLMNLTQVKISHPIYFCRHGQSEFNLDDRLGGDPNLTEKGRSDAEALYEFIASMKEDLEDPSHHVECTPRLLRMPNPGPLPSTLVMECSSAAMVNSNNAVHSRVNSDVGGMEAVHGGIQHHGAGVYSIGSGMMTDSPANSSATPFSVTPLAAPHKGSSNGDGGESHTGSEAASSRSHSAAHNPPAQHHRHHSDPNNLYVAQRRQLQSRGMEIWTSQLRRAIQTAMPAEKRLGLKTLRLHSLNEIHAGVCENMTYKEVKEVYPLIHRFRGEDKFAFRYPGGESYQDLVARIESVIMELENANRVVVVVAHQAVLRGLLAYFGSASADECVHVEVPHRTVWRCTYDAKGTTQMHSVKLGPREEQQT